MKRGLSLVRRAGELLSPDRARRSGEAARASCEIHVPISPTPGFLSQIHLLAASVRRHGGALRDARIVVTVSRDHEPFDIPAQQPWARRYPIEWRWMDEAAFARDGIFGTALRRFTYDFDADFVLLLDADTLCTAPLDGLLELGDGALAGLVTHVAPGWGGPLPYTDGRPRDDGRFWEELYESAGLPAPRKVCQHTGWGFMDHDPRRRTCPPYFNLGVLAADRATMARVGSRVFEEMANVERHVDTVFRCQLAVTLALARTGTPWRELPPRFNFPNDAAFARAYPEEADRVAILHYLRGDELDRWRLATSAGELDAFLARTDLSPVNELLRDRLAGLRGELAEGLPSHA